MILISVLGECEQYGGTDLLW